MSTLNQTKLGGLEAQMRICKKNHGKNLGRLRMEHSKKPRGWKPPMLTFEKSVSELNIENPCIFIRG